MQMFKSWAILSLLVINGTVSAQEGQSQSELINSPSSGSSVAIKKSLLSRDQSATNNDTKFVDVTGYGGTPESARKDAARLALQNVIGTFIDARRRIELNISEQKTSEIVEEKILSYTNGYVSIFEVNSINKDGMQYIIKARVGVSVAPLLKTLQDNDLPVVAFNAIAASATAETLGERKINAIKIYDDLVNRIDGITVVGIGEPQVDTALPSSHDEAWLSIPITFKINPELYHEWKTKYAIIADRTVSFTISKRKISDETLNYGNCKLFSPGFFSPYRLGEDGKFFTHPINGDVQKRSTACFTSFISGNDVKFDCYSKDFDVTNNDNCRSGKPCIDIWLRRSQIKSGELLKPLGLNIDFIDKENKSIELFHYKFNKPLSFDIYQSRKTAPDRQRGFVDLCPTQQTAFFMYYRPFSAGDMIVFSPIDYTVKLTAYALMKNTKISEVTSAKAGITREVNP